VIGWCGPDFFRTLNNLGTYELARYELAWARLDRHPAIVKWQSSINVPEMGHQVKINNLSLSLSPIIHVVSVTKIVYFMLW